MSIAPIAFASLANGQQIYPDGIKDLHDSKADQNQQVYSQAESLTEKIRLDLMAVNDPGAFSGLPVASMEGGEIGKVMSIARKKSDQSLHAIISTADGATAAIKFAELSLAALAYWDPAGALDDQHFQEADFEPVSQYQTGHTAWGSLANPEAQPVDSRIDEPDDAETSASTAERLADAANGLDQSTTTSVYQPVGSSVVQLALTRPDAFQQRLLISETGETLGQIDYIARNLTNQELYAVVARSDGASRSAVKLAALALGKLLYQPDNENPAAQIFAEKDFEPVRGQ